MSRRLLALLLVLAPAADAAAFWIELGGQPHRCDDHVCACPRQSQPKRGGNGCHEGAESTPRTLQSRCGHTSAGPRLVNVRPYLLPEPALTAPVRDLERAVAVPSDAPADGYDRHDLQPPRSR